MPVERKGSTTKALLLSNAQGTTDDSGDDDPEDGSPRFRVVSALRKLSHQITTATSGAEGAEGADGSADDAYSFQKTLLLGRYQMNEERALRKSGMNPFCHGAPISGMSNTRKSPLRRVFRRRKRSSAAQQPPKKPKQSAVEDGGIFETCTTTQDNELDQIMSSGLFRCFSPRVNRFLNFVVEDWLCLAVLGVTMAVLSYCMDKTIEALQNEHDDLMTLMKLKGESAYDFDIATFVVWVAYAIVLVTASALFAHYVAPQAIGSGIPEMKTIMRGVVLKEYLTIRTLISKVVGLMLALGSGLPVGKEGPFVHVASVVANLLSKLTNSFNTAYANESRSSEMLAAGCAVGVACTFSAPVGGVLFSIEVTSVYFAVRNYWRGFFAAACSATVFQLLKLWSNEASFTIQALYQTSFPPDAFMPHELPIFAMVGLLCGLLSAGFVLLHRRMVFFLRRNKLAKKVFQKYWLIYPIFVSFIVATVTYPDGLGQFLGSGTRFSRTIGDFFLNCSFVELPVNHTGPHCAQKFYDVWTSSGSHSAFVSLSFFMVAYYFLAAVASTVPIPSGIFAPSFILGSSIGRIIGEVVSLLWVAERPFPVYPGIYAVVGAAAFCGGVTHTVSIAVIVFELTGQLVFMLPVMIAVLISNAVASYLQPSIYDSIIQIKHLPYLPDIPYSSSSFHGIRVEQFMTTNVHFLSLADSTYAEMRCLLMSMNKLKSFPVVENRTNMILIGSCSRIRMSQALNKLLSPEARQAEAALQVEAIKKRYGPRKQSVIPKDASIQIPPRSPPAPADGVPRNRFTITKIESPRSKSEGAPANLRRAQTFLDTLRRRPCEKEKNPDAGESQYHTITALGGVIRSITNISFRRRPREVVDGVPDLFGDERACWEISQLSKKIDLDEVVIDPAPFQLVENSSLFKVHSLFSLLGLNRAYITNCGKLLGVVTLSDLRSAIEDVHEGLLTATSPSMLWVQTSDFEGSHLMGNGFGDDVQDENEGYDDEDADDEDAVNDRLNPKVSFRNSSECPGDHQIVPVEPVPLSAGADMALRHAQKKLGTASDPCLHTLVTTEPKMSSAQQPSPAEDPPSRFMITSVISIPEIVVDTAPSLTSISDASSMRNSSQSNVRRSSISESSYGSFLESPNRRKKNRHVKISIPDDSESD